MAKSNLIEALQSLAHEKRIDEDYLIKRLEDSMARSYKHTLKLKNEASVIIDRNSNQIYVFERVPQGDPDPETGEYAEYTDVDVTPPDVSRIAALNAKGVIKSIVRDAARQNIYEEFSGRIGEIITGTVLQRTRDFTIIKIRDGVEAELPHFDKKRHPKERNEVPATEHYRHNQRLKVLIIDVRNPQDPNISKNDLSRPTIVVSRTHPNLIRALFEMEVPEIYDGLVEIKSVSREPGARVKIAVSSNEPNLDPVGACVGPKGGRVRMVVEELHNERVDVIQYEQDPAKYIINALSPARILKVDIDNDTKTATVLVSDEQLSLAIGKEGQNARLAAKLTGWSIDIQSTSFTNEELEESSEVSDKFDGICAYVSENGVRCRNRAREGLHFCGIHAEHEQDYLKNHENKTENKEDSSDQKDEKSQENEVLADDKEKSEHDEQKDKE